MHPDLYLYGEYIYIYMMLKIKEYLFYVLFENSSLHVNKKKIRYIVNLDGFFLL
jgi:hypothetical protein